MHRSIYTMEIGKWQESSTALPPLARESNQHTTACPNEDPWSLYLISFMVNLPLIKIHWLGRNVLKDRGEERDRAVMSKKEEGFPSTIEESRKIFFWEQEAFPSQVELGGEKRERERGKKKKEIFNSPKTPLKLEFPFEKYMVLGHLLNKIIPN